jgi:chromosome segregation ATPase
VEEVVRVARDKITVRVDDEQSRRLDRSEVNVSGLVRSLLDNYFVSTDTVEAGLQKQLADLEDELARLEREKTDLETRIERKRREIERVEHKLKQRRESTPEEAVEFAEKIESGQFPIGNLDADNVAVQNYAEKAGIPDPEKFVLLVREEIES